MIIGKRLGSVTQAVARVKKVLGRTRSRPDTLRIAKVALLLHELTAGM